MMDITDEDADPDETERLPRSRRQTWAARLGGEGAPPVDNPEAAAANRARLAGREKRKPKPQPDPLSPQFISAARRVKTERQ
jgi:hypothetical protein